jgi:hypothetical protein
MDLNIINFNNYFHSGSGEKKISINNGFPNSSSNSDQEKMPPPKFAPIKKRKSKRSVDFGRTKSAPVTPTPPNEQQELSLNANQDSDSEYGFDSQWT